MQAHAESLELATAMPSDAAELAMSQSPPPCLQSASPDARRRCSSPGCHSGGGASSETSAVSGETELLADDVIDALVADFVAGGDEPPSTGSFDANDMCNDDNDDAAAAAGACISGRGDDTAAPRAGLAAGIGTVAAPTAGFRASDGASPASSAFTDGISEGMDEVCERVLANLSGATEGGPSSVRPSSMHEVSEAAL